MSSFKAYMTDGVTVHTIMLPKLTTEHLRQQILQVAQPAHVNNVLMAIVNGNGDDIETDENVICTFKRDHVYFTAQFQSSFFLLKKIIAISNYKTHRDIPNTDGFVEKKEMEKQTQSHKMDCSLVLLAGAMQYEKQSYLEDVKHDFHLNSVLPVPETINCTSYHCFVCVKLNRFILMTRDKNILIKYNEARKEFDYEMLPSLSKSLGYFKYGYICLHKSDIILFGGTDHIMHTLLSSIHIYKIKEKTWIQCNQQLPFPMSGVAVVASHDERCLHLIGGKNVSFKSLQTISLFEAKF
ncbi:hypothetical protein RFI_35646 [Reticulomyxa filosa]|uniref:Kelch motif family protein n=1 Tax=Reticulomyxa filosa TaxID=46433 RepID=X6LIL3_RETFI|nr:hypothetical protein RFI_35646 [Reticulomyxa filosa]|eukprot:ETO01793.1 hypothetical protein RFI_35646 [Reticulomyxa filosa]